MFVDFICSLISHSVICTFCFPLSSIYEFCSLVFFFNDPATTEIYTLSLHDALPIWPRAPRGRPSRSGPPPGRSRRVRSEEHTSELQSRQYLVCRLLLEKKKKTKETALHKKT